MNVTSTLRDFLAASVPPTGMFVPILGIVLTQRDQEKCSRSNDANVMTRTHWHFWISKTSASNTFDEIWKATDNSLFCFVSGFPASINVSFWYPFFSSSPCSLS
ncbi:Uncharacterized protein APZ42_014787 [Daphnia magna]|uniref:Uncharacterized protein n=1 Tax=Daphnia magna TaxID=35525 RepID=A0A162PLJ1_9CRUS|nr:Uncharacterized protein APZ42_014787 [Daphnia magna]